MRTKAHEADHTATGHVQQLSPVTHGTVYIRMPRTTVTMSLGADWLYLEVFYSHLIAKRSALNETHGPEWPLPRKLRHGWELRQR